MAFDYYTKNKFLKIINTSKEVEKTTKIMRSLGVLERPSRRFRTLITGEEIGVYGYDLETRAQLVQWEIYEKPRPGKTRQVFFLCLQLNSFLSILKTWSGSQQRELVQNLGRAKSGESDRNFERTTHRFCTTTTIRHISPCFFRVLGETKHCYNVRTTLFPRYIDISPSDFNLFPKFKR